MRTPAILASLMLAASSSSLLAGMIWHDSFSFTPGAGISSAGAPAWYLYATGTEPAVAAGNTGFPGLPSGPGTNSVLFNGTGSTGIAMRSLNTVYNISNVRTLFYSLTFQVTSITAADWGGSGNWLTGSFMLAFNQEASGSLAQNDVAAPLLIRTGDPTNASGAANDYQGFQLGAGVTATSAERVFDATHTYAPGTVLFLVLSYTFNEGAQNDVAKLYVNPTPGSPEEANTPAVVVTGVTDVLNNQVQTFFLRNNSVEPAATLIDDLRIGTNWADVTPSEPVASPSLRIAHGGANAVLTWPINRRGFVLETRTNLSAPDAWREATNTALVDGSNFTVTVSTDASTQFFRLRSPGPGRATVESLHFGFNASNPGMTDSLRLSRSTGINWWSLNTDRFNPEDGMQLPYAYHDGYVENIDSTTVTPMTPAQAALRWWKILHGQGDTFTGASPATVGLPSIILLDEVTTNFKDWQQGPSLREALRIYIEQYGGSRDDIVAFLQRSASLTATPGSYTNLIYCANHYLRCIALELYCSHQGFVTGSDPDNTLGYSGDTYLANRMALPIKRWADAGVLPFRIMPVLAPGNFASYSGYSKPFHKFLNREFWFLANGWYNATHSASDPNIKAALRNGVGTYTWAPGTGIWQLDAAETGRDSRFEEYLRWYCVEGRTDPHPDSVDAL